MNSHSDHLASASKAGTTNESTVALAAPAQHTPGPIHLAEHSELTVLDALRAAMALRHYAEKEREDSKGRIHNAKFARLDEAARCDHLASRLTEWAEVEQARLNYAQGAGVRTMMAGRAAARAAAPGPDGKAGA